VNGRLPGIGLILPSPGCFQRRPFREEGVDAEETIRHDRRSMKTATIEEVLSRPEEMLAGEESVMVTRDGKPTAVVYPLKDPQKIPMEIRRKLFAEASGQVGQELRAKGITQEEVDRYIEDLLRQSRGRH